MKWQVCFGVVLLLATHVSVQADQVEVFGAKDSPGMDIACLTKKCLLTAGSCILSEKCRHAISCAKKCFEMWDNDTTSEKYHVQNCTNICAFSYGQEVSYANIMKCAGDHHCASFPAIPSQCRAPGKLTLLKKLPSEILEGSWWVVKGKHPVYDCYPCQHLSFKRINATTFSYDPDYQVYLANGSLYLVHDHFTFANTTPGANITVGYHDVGLAHSETWWLLDAAVDKSYVLIYYCGNALQWYYDGALVLSKEKTLSDFDYANIAASYSRAVGLNSVKFCNTKTTPCPET